MEEHNNFDPLALAKESNTFCIFPWIHQYVGPPGDVKPCCVYDYNQQIGTMKENTLKEIWNNEKTKQMRLNFLKGVEEPNCSICNNRKELEHTFRANYNRMFFENNKEIQDIVSDTLPDGTLPTHKLKYIDVRFNNLCNLSCRSCAPHYSTSWIADHKKLYNRTQKISDIKNVDSLTIYSSADGLLFPGKTEAQALDEILPHLEYADMVYFAGGEPLMQKEHYRILDRLIELNRLDVKLRYNTNFSILKLKEFSNVLEYWKKFEQNVSVYASIDGSYKKAEYWRNGTVWEDIVKNRELMMLECPDADFRISYTLSWPNSHNLIDLHREWVERKFIKPDGIMINPLDTPSPYCLKNLPDFKKQEIEKLFNTHLEWISSNFKYASGYIENIFQTALKFMWQEHGRNKKGIHDSLKEFSRLTKKLDEIRNQSFFDVYQEHINIKDYMTQHNLHDKFNY